MQEYTYRALDGQGKEVIGTVETENSRDAISQVRDLNLFPTKVFPTKDKAMNRRSFSEIVGDFFIELGQTFKEL